MTHFEIIYKNGNHVLTTENRTHETDVMPSERMIKNALHSVCLNNRINSFEWAKAELYRNGGYLCSYTLNTKPSFIKSQELK